MGTSTAIASQNTAPHYKEYVTIKKSS
nr:unnamed protein product [Callosobruchus analis]